MLTSKQIKNIQSINNPLVKQRFIKWAQLPQDLRQMMFNAETADIIYQVAQKNKLNNDQLWWTSHTIGMIMLGEGKITDFVKILQDKCNLDEIQARQLARDINKVIFIPVSESLKSVHKLTEWPQNKEPTPEPAPAQPTNPEPQLNGNIVDLKGE